MKTLRNSILCVWATGIGLAQVGVDSGWTFQNPQLTGNALHAVAVLNAKHSSRGRLHLNTMIAVGDQGSILRTTDGGATWTQISSGTTAGLSGVSFAGANTGVAVGGQGVILRTMDGGATWTLEPSLTTSALNDVSFIDASTATVVNPGLSPSPAPMPEPL